MTRQEIEAKISTIRNNNALPEKQKGMLLDKYEKMLVDATIGDSDAGKIAPAKEKKAPAPRKPRTPKEPKVTAPKTPAMGEPDCDDLFEQDRERKAKAAIAAEKRRNAPKKTEATKNKEAVEKASAKVEKSVEKRIKSGDVSVAEIKKIIEEYETALKKLRQLLTRAEGKMKFGGPVKDQDISKLADKARDISNHHCGCNDKYEGGGDSGDNYGGQRDKIVAELKSMKGGLDNKAPKVFLKNGLIYVSAENGDNYADYYQYSIDEQLEELADKYDTYWDWEDAGSIVLSPIDSYARGGSMYKDGGIAYKDAVAEFNDELREHPSIKKLAENYNKTPIEVVKHLQPRIKTKGNRAGKTVEVSIDFTDTNTNINTKHVKKFGDGGSMYAGGGDIRSDIEKAKKKLIAKAKSKGIYENFGQNEVRQLQDKYGFSRELADFEMWAMDYDGRSYGLGGDISKAKSKLIAKAKKSGIYENFGDDEVRALKDKYHYEDLLYGSPDQRKMASQISSFDDWAMNYDGRNYSTGGSMPKGWKHKSK